MIDNGLRCCHLLQHGIMRFGRCGLPANRAKLLLNERHQITVDAFTSLRIWDVPVPVRGSAHRFKYSLALVVRGNCVLRYDNEAGKGDHKHLGEVETAYRFTDAATLLADFWKDVDEWMAR